MGPRSTVSRRGFLATLATTETIATTRTTPVATVESIQASDGKPLVVGYYLAGNRLPPESSFEKLTDVVYAFLAPKTDGTVGLPEELTNSDFEIPQSRPNTRFHVSIGGGEHSENFAEAAERSKTFATEAVGWMREYGFDGINIDWEYPETGDADDFRQLLAACRAKLDRAERRDGKRYYLTIAGGNYPGSTPHRGIKNNVDYVFVMTYDYHGPWPSAPDRTGFNAPLFTPNDRDVANDSSVADSMQMWADWGIPRDMLVTGLPFYGRRYELTSNVRPDTDGLGETFVRDEVQSASYSDIATQYLDNPDYDRHWHGEAKVPWLYSPEDNVFVSYDGPESIGHKVDYTLDNGFAGVMIWELTQDHEAQLLDVIDERRSKGSGDATVIDVTVTTGTATATGRRVTFHGAVRVRGRGTHAVEVGFRFSDYNASWRTTETKRLEVTAGTPTEFTITETVPVAGFSYPYHAFATLPEKTNSKSYEGETSEVRVPPLVDDVSVQTTEIRPSKTSAEIRGRITSFGDAREIGVGGMVEPASGGVAHGMEIGPRAPDDNSRFTVTVEDLTPDTAYIGWAFASVHEQLGTPTVAGEKQSFRTKKSRGSSNRERIEFIDCTTVRVTGEFGTVMLYWSAYVPGIVTNQDPVGPVSGTRTITISDVEGVDGSIEDRAVIDAVGVFEGGFDSSPDLRKENPRLDACHDRADPE